MEWRRAVRRNSHQLGPLVRRKIALPAYWKYVKHSHVLEYARELQTQQWNSIEQNEAIQAAKLYKLLNYSSVSIPYYKELVQKHGIRVSKDSILDELHKFPILTRSAPNF